MNARHHVQVVHTSLIQQLKHVCLSVPKGTKQILLMENASKIVPIVDMIIFLKEHALQVVRNPTMAMITVERKYVCWDVPMGILLREISVRLDAPCPYMLTQQPIDVYLVVLIHMLLIHQLLARQHVLSLER